MVGVVGAPATLDPYAPRASDLTRTLVRPIYPSLFTLLPDGTTRADLAASLEEYGRGARVRLHDRKWSSGRAISAHDVVRSIRRARAPSGFTAIRSVRSIGPRTVALEGDVDDWRTTLATAAFVLPGGRGGRVPRVSGGPWRVKSHVTGLKLVYERNPSWPGTDALLSEVEVVFTEGVDVFIGLMGRSRLDVGITPSSVNLDDRLSRLGYEHRGARGWESIFLDLRASSLTRPQRFALWRALDRAAIHEGFVREDGRVADTLRPTPGPEGAAGEFADVSGQSGRPPSATVTVAVSSGDELLQLIGRALFRQLERAGFEVELLVADTVAVEARAAALGHVDATLRRRAGAPGLEDPPGAARRLRMLPLFHVESVIAFRPGLVGAAPNPTLEGPLWNLETWWIEPR